MTSLHCALKIVFHPLARRQCHCSDSIASSYILHYKVQNNSIQVPSFLGRAVRKWDPFCWPFRRAILCGEFPNMKICKIALVCKSHHASIADKISLKKQEDTIWQHTSCTYSGKRRTCVSRKADSTCFPCLVLAHGSSQPAMSGSRRWRCFISAANLAPRLLPKSKCDDPDHSQIGGGRGNAATWITRKRKWWNIIFANYQENWGLFVSFLVQALYNCTVMTPACNELRYHCASIILKHCALLAIKFIYF